VRIAQVSTSSGPVRQDQTGSVESLVWLLTRELLALGHEVTVFGCGGSEVPAGAEFVQTHPSAYGKPGTPSDWQLCDWMTLSAAVDQSSRFDVLHSHAYLWGLPLERFTRCPMVHTLHTMPYHDEALLWDRVPNARITAVSRFQWSRATTRIPADVIHHGVDPDHFPFSDRHQGYLCYLGRFLPGKGPLEAIAAARQSGMPIILAGPANRYFEEHIRPHLDDDTARYVGPVTATKRSQLLGGAAALLYPLTEPEPFGLVQVEAMMCGTPVAATAIGAVPEIVEPGISGALAASASELPRAILDALTLDRHAVRERALLRFGSRAMAQKHEQLYVRTVAAGQVHSGV
jgi:glycosyltransferase involved in cell wall biosynthesis